jgi:hypothetical protein
MKRKVNEEIRIKMMERKFIKKTRDYVKDGYDTEEAQDMALFDLIDSDQELNFD